MLAQTAASIPPDRADDDRGIAVLLHVVAGAEHEGVPQLGTVIARRCDVLRQRRTRPLQHRCRDLDVPGIGGSCVVACGLGVEIDEEQMLGELRSSGEDPARAVDHQRVAVEDQIVLPADEVHVRDDRLVRDRPPHHEREAHAGLVPLERGAVDHEQHADVGSEHPLDRTAVAPEVLADDDRDVHAADAQHQELIAGDEDPELVEHGVVRQVVLRVARDDGAPVQHARAVLRDRRGCVARALRARLERTIRVPDDDRQLAEALVRERAGQPGYGGSGRPEEARAGGEVLDRVAADRALADGEEIGALLERAFWRRPAPAARCPRDRRARGWSAQGPSGGQA